MIPAARTPDAFATAAAAIVAGAGAVDHMGRRLRFAEFELDLERGEFTPARPLSDRVPADYVDATERGPIYKG